MLLIRKGVEGDFMVEHCDFYSDDEFQQALELEEYYWLEQLAILEAEESYAYDTYIKDCLYEE